MTERQRAAAALRPAGGRGKHRDRRLSVAQSLATNGFEQSELEEPKKALEKAGATADVISPAKDMIRGWKHTEWGTSVPVDVELERADVSQYDGLLLPGGVINPDALRLVPKAIDFIRAFSNAGKPIAAICHGPWTLINAGAVRGRKLTSWPSLRVDLENAGAEWVDREVAWEHLQFSGSLL